MTNPLTAPPDVEPEDGDPQREAGYAQATRCVVTRIEFDHWSSWLVGLIYFLRLRRAVRRARSVLDTTVLLRPNKTLIFISIWQTPRAILDFHAAFASHVGMANWAHHNTSRVWSARFSIEKTGYMSQWLSWTVDGIRSIRSP